MSWLIDECFSDIIMLGGNCSRGTKFFLFIACIAKHRQCRLCRGVKEDSFLVCAGCYFLIAFNFCKVLKLIVGCIFSFLTGSPRLCYSLWYTHSSPRLWQYVLMTCFAHNYAVLPCTSGRVSRGMAELLLTQDTWGSSGPAWGKKRKDHGDGKCTAQSRVV